MTVLITLNEIERLKKLYTAGFQDTFLNNALHKIIERQIARDEADLRHVNETLRQFEQQYGLASDEFQQRFQAGQMADTADFMEWNVFCKMRERLTARLRILQGETLNACPDCLIDREENVVPGQSLNLLELLTTLENELL